MEKLLLLLLHADFMSLSCAALNFCGTVIRTFLLFRDLSQLQCNNVTDILTYARFLSMVGILCNNINRMLDKVIIIFCGNVILI